MRAVGVREFRDRAASMMRSGETLVIERRGKPIGFFVPLAANDRSAGREALGRLGDVASRLLAEAGLDEDELVRKLAGGRRKA